MNALAAPILAQLLTLGVSDRTEAQYVASEEGQYARGASSVAIGLDLAGRHASLRLGYSPSFTLTPLEGPDRELIVFHNGALSGEYRYRRTSFGLSQSVGYGKMNFRDRALAAPQTPAQGGVAAPTTPAPAEPSDEAAPDGGTGTDGGTTGTTAAPNAQPGTQSPDAGVTRTIAFNTFHTAASLAHLFSRSMTLTSEVGYTISGGADRASRRDYGLVRGPNAGVNVSYALDGRNSLTQSLSANLVYPEGGNSLLLARFTEGYSHVFTSRTSGAVGLGISYSREEQPNGSQINGIYPTANASIGSSDRLAHGTLSFGAQVSAAPVLDMSTVSARLTTAQAEGAPIIDPRLAASVGTSWGRNDFSANLGLGTSVTLRPGEPSSLNSIGANAGINYTLGAGFTFSTGVRGAWQTLAGATVVPPSGGVFAALGWAAAVPLNRY